MKACYVLTLTCVLAAFAHAQEGSSASRSRASPGIDLATNVEAELQKQLDVKNAKVGDTVLLKATKTVKQNGQTVIWKGSSIIGRVTEVRRNAKDRTGSAVTMVFDRLQNGGASLPVKATIVSVTNVAASATVGDDSITDLSGSSRVSGSAASGPRLVGGLANTVGGVTRAATQTLGSTLSAATRTTPGTLGTAGRTVNGLQISNSASGSASASSTVSTRGKNLRIEKGARFDLAVSVATQD